MGSSGGIVMRKGVIAIVGAGLCAVVVTGSGPVAADILVNISKSSQRMAVLVDGSTRYNWKVSTGTKRYTTPSGVFKPQWLARKWRSKQYANAPMPHSIFFHKGYAIHGTAEVGRLGKIASHGCVRLHPENAAKLFELVQNQMANTRVVVSDDIIEVPGQAPKKRPFQFVAENVTDDDTEVVVMDLKDIALAALAALPESAPLTESTPREIARPKSARTKVARVQRGGFHW